MFAVAAQELRRAIAGLVRERGAGGRIIFEVEPGTDELLFQDLLHALVGERHGSQGVARASGQAGQIAERSQHKDRLCGTRCCGSLESAIYRRVPRNAVEFYIWSFCVWCPAVLSILAPGTGAPNDDGSRNDQVRN